jgi:predicted phosphodiesterase
VEACEGPFGASANASGSAHLEQAVKDLGTLEGPALVFGGPYSNLQATQALLARADQLGISPSRIICTGDVVAYCADPEATVSLIRRSEMAVVMGNCEESLGFGTDDCGCGFSEGSACDLLSVQWFAYARNHLSAAAKQWMRDLPRALTFRMAGRRFRVVHGSVASINRFVFASTPLSEKEAEFELGDADAIIGGHCGLPFTQVIGDRLWHNAGVIGMPANDGTPRVWFALLTPEGSDVRIETHSLQYDYGTAAEAMAAAGLPAAYAKTLGDGLWPNLDILPETETAATGRPLSETTIVWHGNETGRSTMPRPAPEPVSESAYLRATK